MNFENFSKWLTVVCCFSHFCLFYIYYYFTKTPRRFIRIKCQQKNRDSHWNIFKNTSFQNITRTKQRKENFESSISASATTPYDQRFIETHTCRIYLKQENNKTSEHRQDFFCCNCAFKTFESYERFSTKFYNI